MTKFYDAAYPDNLPADCAACVYGDGDFTASADQVKRLKVVRYITVLGNFKSCGIADYEAGNAVFSRPGALRAWVLGRNSMGCRARVYVGRDNLPAAFDAVGLQPNVVWWIATLDGKQRTRDEIVSLCASEAPLEASKVWAQQYAGGPDAKYDESVLYGTW